MNRSKKNDTIAAVIMLGVGTVLALMIASAMFLFLMQLDPAEATPTTTFEYFQYFATDDKVGNALFVGYLVGLLPLGFIFFLLFKPDDKKLFGDYRFAKLKDVKDAGLLKASERAILLGTFKDKYLYFGGQEFVMVYAPTRSGKGVKFVIPNLLSFPDSVVCLDIKYENYEITSGFRRKHGQDVYLFAPGSTDRRTHRWNPLEYISDDRNQRLNDLDRIANFLIPTPPGSDPMWSAEGRSLFRTIMLLVIDTPDIPHTIGEVLRQIRTEMPIKKYFESILEDRKEDLDPECVRGLSEFINTPDKTAGGIKKTVTGSLNAWSNPLVDAATEANDFDVRELRKRKMTIYLGVSQNDLTVFAPVFNLFVQQLIDLNTQRGDLPPRYDAKGALVSGSESIRYQCLLLLDEFCALGRMESIAKGVSYIAGYNLRLMPIFQSEYQLRDTYGDQSAENILENHAVRVFFRPTRMRQAKALSDEMGSTTVESKSKSMKAGLEGGSSQNISQAKRALLLPEEIMEMPEDDQIILARSCHYPIYAQNTPYFKNKDLFDRISGSSSVPEIAPTNYPVRGTVFSTVDVLCDRINLPRDSAERALTDSEIDNAVDSFFDIIEDSDGDDDTSSLSDAVSGLFGTKCQE